MLLPEEQAVDRDGAKHIMLNMGQRKNGFTLIELVIFIVIGAIFLPLTYIAFSSVTREAVTPESIVRARFIAEAKMEDLTKETFDNIPASSSSYTNVNADSRYTDTLYAGYQWKWIISYTAYQDNSDHITTTIGTPSNWAANTPYKIADYVQPTTSNGHFYRFSEIYADNWTPRDTNYYVNKLIQPTSSNYNGHFYKCIQVFPSKTPRSGNSEPSWPTASGGTVNDGSFKWQEYTRSGSSQPSWPTSTSSTVNDGGIVWRESLVYKLIVVYVKTPRGYEYIVNTIVTSRTAS